MELARNDYGGVAPMARTWSRIARTKANNERAVQIRYFKKVWLSNNSPYTMAWKEKWKFARRLLFLRETSLAGSLG
jgi:hypothetical protein